MASRAVPAVATLLALAYATAVTLPALLPAVTVAACVAACALVLTLRRTSGLRWLLPGLAIWLAVGFGGALLLRGEALRGPAWIAATLFLVPLLLIPWLYARTFEVTVGNTPSDPPAQIHRCARDDGAHGARDDGTDGARDEAEPSGVERLGTDSGETPAVTRRSPESKSGGER